MLRRVTSDEGREVVVHKGKRDCSGIVFPYSVPGGERPHSYRIRLDSPE